MAMTSAELEKEFKRRATPMLEAGAILKTYNWIQEVELTQGNITVSLVWNKAYSRNANDAGYPWENSRERLYYNKEARVDGLPELSFYVTTVVDFVRED